MSCMFDTMVVGGFLPFIESDATKYGRYNSCSLFEGVLISRLRC